MLRKLALDQTKIYEKAIVIEEISNMLLSFVRGDRHHIAIGSEQGDIEKWDDIVIETNDSKFIHVQVKRQTTPFSKDPCIRDKYGKKSKKREGEYKELSQLDETFKSMKEALVSSKESKEFWLILPDGAINIKKDLEIRHFRQLCEVHVKSITTPIDLERLASEDASVRKIFEWLTTWCEFENWEEILKAIRVLKISTPGLEAEIDERSKRNLGQIFRASEVDTVFNMIRNYIDDNSTYAGAIRPRQLMFQLKDYIKPETKIWTMFKTKGSSWNLSGILDLEVNDEIERPSVIVPALWSEDNTNARSLKIQGKCVESCQVSESLMRLSLHPRASFDILCSDKPSWYEAIRRKTGGTLGVSSTDMIDMRLLDGLDIFTPSESKDLITNNEKEDFSEQLHIEMLSITFNLVDCALAKKIREMQRSVLRDRVESRWSEWKKTLEVNIDEQRSLFTKILHPNAEGMLVEGELRVGPKTVELICEALFFMIIASVCLSDETNQDWKVVADKLEMRSVGLAFWSGPSSSKGNVIRIDDEGVKKLIENESSEILIISQATASDIEIYEDDIYGGEERVGLLTYPNNPKLLITNDFKFRRLLSRGDIAQMKEFFQNKLNKYDCSFDKAISVAVDEVAK